jgi:NAD(P)-dependent dehydrogenase (short-subunit alcohol dehydrogenase family)
MSHQQNPQPKLYPDKFAGQLAIVTGAAQGIGEVTAQILAAQGATVILVDRQEEKLSTVSNGILHKGGKAVYYVLDVTDDTAVNRFVRMVIETHGQIHIMIHLAGIYPTIPIEECTTEDYRRIMAVNMDASFFFVRAVLPHMNEHGYGRIICTASGTMQNVLFGHSVYIAAKAAIAHFMRATAVECKLGVTANTICPGLIASPAVREKFEGSTIFDETIAKQSVKRVGVPEDIAYTICFIASPESSFTSGQIFDVGGGATYL